MRFHIYDYECLTFKNGAMRTLHFRTFDKGRVCSHHWAILLEVKPT